MLTGASYSGVRSHGEAGVESGRIAAAYNGNMAEYIGGAACRGPGAAHGE